MGTNYFGHFMLTALLRWRPRMPASSRSRPSPMVRLQQVPLLRQGRVQDKGNYAASKLACLTATIES